MHKFLTLIGWIAWLTSLLLASQQDPSTPTPDTPRAPAAGAAHGRTLFETSQSCMACHNGLTLSSGEDVSIGSSWRATMMANSSRDPYWQASVRRETIDHPKASGEIEDECSVCHMPMARAEAVANGGKGSVFAHLPIGRQDAEESRLAADGVSCTMCHQIRRDRLGTPESFTGGFVVDTSTPAGERAVFGPFQIDKGRTRIMHSSSTFVPTESAHIRQSELCATCHTLYTKARGPQGEVIGEFPEQVPFLEWQHSAYRREQSCQGCHMPVVAEKTRIASVLGDLREGLARHTFRGGNFFILRMLNRYRTDLGVDALPQELEASARDTEIHLASQTATVSIERVERSGGQLAIDVAITNLSGHKLPTAYPSRRVWIHLTVKDQAGRAVFESGGVAKDGSIAGNDNDANATAAEPHYREIRRPDEVEIYESVMSDTAGRITTGLLQAVTYVKDNRLLPRGFDKATAHKDIAVHGAAAEDDDFMAGGDRVRYLVDAGSAGGPFLIEAELAYQPIGFRWAQNLKGYGAAEPRRFVKYYDAMAAATTQVLGRATLTTR
jgi:cytochrome c551/c552